jgi:hypothetical protein
VSRRRFASRVQIKGFNSDDRPPVQKMYDFLIDLINIWDMQSSEPPGYPEATALSVENNLYTPIMMSAEMGNDVKFWHEPDPIRRMNFDMADPEPLSAGGSCW